MRTVLLNELPVIELQASKEEGKYYVQLGDKMSFDYQDGEFSQTYVPSSEMTKIQAEVKKMEKDNESKYAIIRGEIMQEQDEEIKSQKVAELETVQLEDRKEIAERLNVQQKEKQKKFIYKVITKEGNLSEVIEKLIKDTTPTYDLDE